MTKKTDKKNKAILPIIKTLEVGESTKYPVSRLNVVRTICSAFGLQFGKKFKANIDHTDNTIQVTRVK